MLGAISHRIGNPKLILVIKKPDQPKVKHILISIKRNIKFLEFPLKIYWTQLFRVQSLARRRLILSCEYGFWFCSSRSSIEWGTGKSGAVKWEPVSFLRRENLILLVIFYNLNPYLKGRYSARHSQVKNLLRKLFVDVIHIMYCCSIRLGTNNLFVDRAYYQTNGLF